MAAGYCIYCGAKYSEGHRFCMGCGRPLDVQQSDIAAYERDAKDAPSGEDKRIPTSRTSSSSGPKTISSLMIDEIFGSDDSYDELEDFATEVYSNDSSTEGDDSEDEVPTSVFRREPALSLKRLRTGTVYELTLPAIVGRGSHCSVRVTGNRYISREHARIEASDDGYVIADHASSNRTFVNGNELVGTSRAQISNGDIVRLADEDFEFIVEQD